MALSPPKFTFAPLGAFSHASTTSYKQQEEDGEVSDDQEAQTVSGDEVSSGDDGLRFRGSATPSRTPSSLNASSCVSVQTKVPSPPPRVCDFTFPRPLFAPPVPDPSVSLKHVVSDSALSPLPNSEGNVSEQEEDPFYSMLRELCDSEDEDDDPNDDSYEHGEDLFQDFAMTIEDERSIEHLGLGQMWNSLLSPPQASHL